MARLLEKAEQFWNVDVVDPNDESRAKASMHVVKKGMLVYIVSTVACGSVALIIPIVFNGWKVLPFQVWIPDRDRYPYAFEVCVTIRFK